MLLYCCALQGMNLTVGSCQNGDMSQLFAATYKDADGKQKENLMPLFWATSAYVGNGVMGLRVQAESAADGIFQLLVSGVVPCFCPAQRTTRIQHFLSPKTKGGN